MPLHTYRHARLFTFLRVCLRLGTLAIVVLVVSGCSGSSTGSLSSDAPPAADVPKLLSITPLTKTVALGATLSFDVSGGTEPYTFDVYLGSGAISGSGDTGTYQAPVSQGTAVVRVQDSEGSAGYATIEITDAPLIQPSTKTLAVNNKFPFAAVGGKAPYVFSIVSGGGSINATTGEFTAGVAADSVVIRVTDTNDRSSDSNVTVNAALSFSVKNAYVEKDTTYTLAATGGVAPYKFLVASGQGSVDSGTGVFTAPRVLGATAIHVFDSLGNVDLATLNTTTSLSISPNDVLIAKNGSLSFNAMGGVPPYSYSVVASGGGSIGSLTGQYISPGFTNSDTVRVTDSLGHTSDATVTVTNNLSFSVATLVLAVGNSFDVSSIVNGGISPLAFVALSEQGSFSGFTYTAPNTPGVYNIHVYDSQSPTPNHVTAMVLVNSALSLLPDTASLPINAQKSFSASGGVPPYVYSVFSGGGTINATSGLYTAPATSGIVVLRVTDARGNVATSTVTVQEALAIVPGTKTLSSGEGFTFTATGGTTPYMFSLVSGSGSINSSSGLYTAPGSAGTANVRVEDAAGNKKDALITILNPLSISPPVISLIKNGAITFTASGGAGPYTFSVASGDGTVNATSGAFVAGSTAGTSTVRVTDSLGSIKGAVVTIYNGLSISPFTKNLAVNQTFTFTATGGMTPYVYSLVSGVGSISASGAYSSSAAGAATVRVKDVEGNTSDASVSVNSALAINPTSKTLGVNNLFSFSAIGGVPPYAYSVLSGNGTVTASGDYKAPAASTTAIVRVTDSNNSTADSTVTVNDPLSISPTSATISAGGTQSFITVGGVSPYAYSIISGGGSFSGSTYTAASVASGASISILVTDVLGNTANATLSMNPITVSITTPNSSTLITSLNKAAFTVSGACSESGRAVNVSTTGGVTATPNCSGGAWTTILDLTPVPDGSVTITASHSNINAVAATPATVILTKDGSNPTISITSPTGGSYVGNSVTVTGTCTKVGPVNFSITGGITGISSCNGSSYSGTLDITSASEGSIVISAGHTDTAGNSATPASVTVTKDSVVPVISAFAITNSSPTSSTTYNLTSTVSETVAQYCILENSTVLASCVWQSGTMPSSFSVSNTNNAKVLTSWVKDAAGNISVLANSNSVTLNTAVPSAPSALALSNPATSPGLVTTPEFLVSGVSVGDSVSIYTDSSCLIGNLKGSATVGTGTTVNVTSSVLTDATYTFYAKTVNTASTASNCSSESVNYTLDAAAPTSPSISINSGAAYTTSTTVPLTLAATGASDMYITNTAGCGSGGTYETYATSKASWTLATANATNTVYAKFKDTAGNESSCVSDNILHDNTGPGAPTALTLGSIPSSDVTTPTLSWTAPADNVGGSGVASYQVQVYNVTTGSVNAWGASTSGSAITGSAGMLVNGETYYMKVRAIDSAGNIGTESAASVNWIATTALNCPTGYILVPPLTGYTTAEFCVSKYEMKDVGSVATAGTAGTPWVSLIRGTDGTTANSAWKSCKDLGTGYDLISNTQWQTIARNIADQAVNWSGGTAYSGQLNSGHSDGNPGSGLAASTDDSPYTGTGNTNADAWNGGTLTTGDEQKRTHSLSNGNVIWDFAGNVWEWTKDNNTTTAYGENHISNFNAGDYRQVNFGNDSFCASPQNTPHCNMGYGWTSNDTNTIIRGGREVNEGGVYSVGIFAMQTAPGVIIGGSSSSTLGFRCVFTGP